MNDFMLAIKNYQLWLALGWNDVLGRYRRSVIGPLWITISMGVTISAMGPLYGTLFGNHNDSFLLHLSLGMIFWNFISSCINDSCNIFHDSSGIIKQSDLPISLYILRVFYRQMVILAHNIIIIPIVMYFSPPSFSLSMLLFIPSIILTSLFMLNISSLIAIFSTRYRDMTPVIQSIMTLMFFITPIIWSVEQLPIARQKYVSINILSSFMDILRSPLMGHLPSNNSWMVCIIATIVSLLTSRLVINKYRSRVAYWL